MSWSPDPHAPRGRLAMVAGATRGAGRGIAAALVTRLGGKGIAVAALAADPTRARWNQRSVSSAELAHEYGFTDVDGSRPDIWCYFEDSRAGDRPADLGDYR